MLSRDPTVHDQTCIHGNLVVYEKSSPTDLLPFLIRLKMGPDAPACLLGGGGDVTVGGVL